MPELDEELATSRDLEEPTKANLGRAEQQKPTEERRLVRTLANRRQRESQRQPKRQRQETVAKDAMGEDIASARTRGAIFGAAKDPVGHGIDQCPWKGAADCWARPGWCRREGSQRRRLRFGGL